MISAVFDTNIFISALVFPGGLPDQIFKLCRTKQIRVYICEPILKEFQCVLKDKFRMPSKDIEQLSELITGNTISISPKSKVNVIKTCEQDNRILECALSSNSGYIVTGDKKHLLKLKKFHTIEIVTAAEFLKRFYEAA